MMMNQGVYTHAHTPRAGELSYVLYLYACGKASMLVKRNPIQGLTVYRERKATHIIAKKTKRKILQPFVTQATPTPRNAVCSGKPSVPRAEACPRACWACSHLPFALHTFASVPEMRQEGSVVNAFFNCITFDAEKNNSKTCTTRNETETKKRYKRLE